MPTHYLLRPDGTLRHGHDAVGNPGKEQWHNADTYHRNDPNAHDRESSWVAGTGRQPRGAWSPTNDDLSSAEKDDLMLNAYLSCERKKIDAMGTWSYAVDEKPHPGAQTRGPREVPIKRDNALTERIEAVVASRPQPEVSEALIKAFQDIEKLPVSSVAQSNGYVTPAVEVAETWTEEVDGSASPADLTDIEERLGNLEELAIALGTPIDERFESLDRKLGTLAEAREVQAERLRDVDRELADLQNRVPDVTESVQDAIAPLAARLAAVEQAQSRKVEYTVRFMDRTVVTSGLNHHKFDTLLQLALSLEPHDRNIWIAGAAGSGKTTAARKLAEVLELQFMFMGAIDSPYKLSGYKDANGRYNSTAFRIIYENGGVILLDEVDGSSPAALLEINAALSNGWANFPDGMVKRHENVYALCAANTWGLGGDAQYVGRARLDAAFLDRFVTVTWDYDEALEREAAGGPTDWVDCVQSTRQNAFGAGAQMVISPRASIKGCQLLRAGVSKADTVEAIFGRYRKVSTWSQIGRAAEAYARD